MAHLVLLETAGNQAFVFATNRLRENIGASELLFQIGTRFVVRAAYEAGGNAYAGLAGECDPADRKSDLSIDAYVSAIDAIGAARPLASGGKVEIVVATSGKALLLVDVPETGRKIVSAVTTRALREAPGAVVRGFVDETSIDVEDPRATSEQMGEAVRRVHEGIETLRARLPAPEARWPTLPFLQPCRSSGLPATHLRRTADGVEPVSVSVRAKENVRLETFERLTNAGLDDVSLTKRLDSFAEKVDWLGVIHADGNGFGRIFLDFARASGATTARDYVDRYRRFSLSLELCSVQALSEAMEAVGDAGSLAVLPVVVGGDDLTVICDGRLAIRLAVAWLRAFERATEAQNLGPGSFPSAIPQIARERKLGAAAGVAIVKPHYPFHAAYEMAEELTKSAKSVKRLLAVEKDGVRRTCDSVSSIDFQIFFAKSAAELDDLRDDWKVDGGATRLTARPYLVSDDARLEAAIADAPQSAARWARNRRWSRLQSAVAALMDTYGPEERLRLARNQQYALRQAIFRGAAHADSQRAFIARRSQRADKGADFDWSAIDGDEKSLFFADPHGRKVASPPPRACYLLDALEVIDVESSVGDKRAERPEAKAS